LKNYLCLGSFAGLWYSGSFFVFEIPERALRRYLYLSLSNDDITGMVISCSFASWVEKGVPIILSLSVKAVSLPVFLVLVGWYLCIFGLSELL
jgi:hypothetical protein